MATSRYAGRDCWPTREQELLLRAALARGSRAIDAWRRWRSAVDLDNLDRESLRLLPQLYHTLRREGFSDPAMGRLKDAYRRTWFENQRLFRAMSGLLRSLHEAGVPTMLLKGGALVPQYYRDYGLRPMDDLDILVPPNQSSAALKLLVNRGFAPVWDTREESEVRARRHGWDFKDADGTQVDLHWRVFHDDVVPDADVEFWRDSVPVTIHGVSSRTLSAAHQLLHVCVHGATWADEPAAHWVADAMAILRATTGGSLDWDGLSLQSQRCRFTVVVRETLRYLCEVVDAPVPPAVLRRLNEARTRRVERIVYRAKTRPTERWGPWLALCVCYLEHASTLPADAGLIKRVAGFPEYYRRRWMAGSFWQVAGAAAFRSMRRVGWALRAHGKRPAGPRPSL